MFKRVLLLVCVGILCISLFGCHNSYYNDGSDYASPDFNDHQEKKPVAAPVDENGISNFEKAFLKEIFGDSFQFQGYDKMSESERTEIEEYFKTYLEGYYTIGFQNGFFYTKNQFEGKEIYSIPWGYESLSTKIEEPTFGKRTKTSFSDSFGFSAEYEEVAAVDIIGYCDKLAQYGFEASDSNVENSPEIFDDNTINREYKDKDGYTVSIIYADSILRINICAPAAE